MIKTYIIHKGKSKKEFQTIKIPRGTVLFRGLSFENKKIIVHYLMTLLEYEMVRVIKFLQL